MASTTKTKCFCDWRSSEAGMPLQLEWNPGGARSKESRVASWVETRMVGCRVQGGQLGGDKEDGGVRRE